MLDGSMVVCPICNRSVKSAGINNHIDSGCQTFLLEDDGRNSSPPADVAPSGTPSGTQKRTASSFFQTPAAKRQAVNGNPNPSTPRGNGSTATGATAAARTATAAKTNGVKRSFDEGPGHSSPTETQNPDGTPQKPQPAPASHTGPSAKRARTDRAAPLAERMRPRSLDEVFGQDLVGPSGVLRSLIDSGRVPSMIMWGGSGTGKTTIARCIAHKVGSRFVELNATSTGVNECKKLFAEAASELGLTGRRTIIFCDEIHRFNKAQQDVFLKPVEAGTITLIGATTENPSFRVQAALLSRCRTFTLSKLTSEDIQRILRRALEEEQKVRDDGSADETAESAAPKSSLSPLMDEEMLAYLANFADGDARTALNLLELAMSLTVQPRMPKNGEAAAAAAATGEAAPTPLTKDDVKAALTKTLVYDRAGDQHYDSISAFHKSIRGSDADAALYYLARMLQSGEDPLYIARRLVVVASEDVGLGDNTLLPLATAAYTAAQQIGLPEARIPLAHATVALCLAPKSTRVYRGLNNAFAALREPGVAALPIPLHLRNAPTRLMREMGYGAEYKYNPNYKDGRVRQDYLPDSLLGRRFLEDRDLGTEVDPDLEL
ncbi:AAA family ATPase [Gaeumannomyces tritici R3-111a-1]|uniref:AAA family ATPase n=1 Tax=Gaeumannomyces tritici (strain R3-111a-1) TaxID=644352 RepID=J3NLY2_GAET3|nr:AAA family ATPase [Gaeumannomyces tritici R3-111a-1]EJT82313.1 AAA family ATPase [Gaeumannomyces tritici R3-111a-1]